MSSTEDLWGSSGMASPTSRIVVHDYSGHPGQAQLSRALAARGYEVTHQHCPAYATGKAPSSGRPTTRSP